ncbi:hypothetical protein IGI37_000219 [Enterococcus sp. AZ194]|uniref:glycosyltransferase family 4 protein n=1 Tax=Enterococcus sp. AZ194 TaxID=2774629 RepID=UPI003F1E6FC9
MKKILIVTPGILPIPATKGGAVEALIETIVEKNERNPQLMIHIVSTFDEDSQRLSKAYRYTQIFYTMPETFIDQMATFYKKSRRIIERTVFNKWKIRYEFPKVLAKSKELLKENSYDKVMILNYPELVLPLKSAIDTEIQLYLHNNNLNERTPKSKEIYESFDKIISVSSYIDQQVSTIRSEKVVKRFVVYNGKDKVEKISDASEITREKWGLSKEDFVAIYTGRLIYQKGVSYIVDSLKYLPPHFKLLIVGGSFYSSNKKNRFLRNLEKAASHYEGRVIFTGYQNPDLIPAFLALSDVGIVFTLEEEACPMTVIEMQLYGKPLICSNAGGIPEIRTEQTSLMIDLETSDDWAQEIAKRELLLSRDKQLIQTISEAGLKESEKFSSENYFRHLLEAIVDE